MFERDIDLKKVVMERVEASLSSRESRLMHAAINSTLLKDKLFINVAGKIYWHLLSAPTSLRGRNFGIADSLQEAEAAIAELLETKQARE